MMSPISVHFSLYSRVYVNQVIFILYTSLNLIGCEKFIACDIAFSLNMHGVSKRLFLDKPWVYKCIRQTQQSYTHDVCSDVNLQTHESDHVWGKTTKVICMVCPNDNFLKKHWA